jgi:UDP-N-acetylmuramoyl-L-alanyl-D-glutamate--2,6-diaminopimelate ligase
MTPDFLLADLQCTTGGLSFLLKGTDCEISICSPLVGIHNAYNLACAGLALLKLGYSPEEISSTLTHTPPVPGRLEPVIRSNRTVYVDYAHKPDALEKVLAFLKPLCKGRLISVIGCGGDRDTGKRPVMGEISRRLADVTVVTSDNPRTEDPHEIIRQVVTGIKGLENYPLVVEADRRAAIRAAIHMAKPEDIILIAGKGHEPYQEINGVKHPFHDVQVVEEILDGLES